MSNLFVNNHCISYKQINKSHIKQFAGTNHVKAALQFLHDWYSKKNSFTFYTSGSTGKPKKIIVLREQLIASATATNKFLKLSKNDVFLVCLNTNFVAGKMMLVRAALLNARIVITEPTANPLLHKFLVEPTFAAFAPMQVEEILNDKASKLTFKKLATAIIGGAPLMPKTLSKVQQCTTVSCWQTYGMTETLSHVALMNLHQAKTYKLLPGIVAKTDHRGCIAVKGKVTKKQWVQTNDVVRMYGANSFKWLGRADFVINSGGIKIHVEEVEQLLAKHVLSLQHVTFFVGSIPDEKLGEKAILVIESNKPFKVVFNAVKKYLHAYKIPKEVHFLPTFNYTNSGKINRIETLKHLTISNLK